MPLLPLPLLHLLVAAVVAICCASTLRSRLSVMVWSFVCAFASTILGMELLQVIIPIGLNPYYISVYTLQGMIFAFAAPVIAILVHVLFFRRRQSNAAP
ncbi:MAG: hypothetical protein ACPGSC_01665 [Granulosicoccaceae bacterium]